MNDLKSVIGNTQPISHRPCCVKCGGNMVGDGHTTVMRCEFTYDEKYEDLTPDAGPVYCDFED